MKMLFTLKIALIFVLSTAFVGSDTRATSATTEYIETIKKPDKIYICGSTGAKKYHKTADCKGLTQCGAEIFILKSPKDALHRKYTPCSLCYKKSK